MAQQFAIQFRVGGEKRNAAESDPAFVAAKAVALIRAKIEKQGVERLAAAVEADHAAIVADIAKDAGKFAEQAARVFTRVKSGASGAVSVSLDDISRRSLVSSTSKMSDRLKGKTTVEWLALSKLTIQNKRQRMKASKKGKRKTASAGEPSMFFVDSGALRALLLEHLGPAMALMVDPKIVVKRGPKKVTVTLSILAQASGKEKAGVTGASLPGISTRGSAREETLFVRYLKKAGAADRDPKHPLAYKLENPRGPHRSFLQPTLVYWISNRLPLVLDASLKRALTKHAKMKKGK